MRLCVLERDRELEERERESVYMCVCVCERERERIRGERDNICECEGKCDSVCVFVCDGESMCLRAFVRLCGRERERVKNLEVYSPISLKQAIISCEY